MLRNFASHIAAIISKMMKSHMGRGYRGYGIKYHKIRKLLVWRQFSDINT